MLFYLHIVRHYYFVLMEVLRVHIYAVLSVGAEFYPIKSTCTDGLFHISFAQMLFIRKL